MPTSEFLRERNARWARLRDLAGREGPGSPAFEAALAELMALIGWPRERVLAGLGWTDEEGEPCGSPS